MTITDTISAVPSFVSSVARSAATLLARPAAPKPEAPELIHSPSLALNGPIQKIKLNGCMVLQREPLSAVKKPRRTRALVHIHGCRGFSIGEKRTLLDIASDGHPVIAPMAQDMVPQPALYDTYRLACFAYHLPPHLQTLIFDPAKGLNVMQGGAATFGALQNFIREGSAQWAPFMFQDKTSQETATPPQGLSAQNYISAFQSTVIRNLVPDVVIDEVATHAGIRRARDTITPILFDTMRTLGISEYIVSGFSQGAWVGTDWTLFDKPNPDIRLLGTTITAMPVRYHKCMGEIVSPNLHGIITTSPDDVLFKILDWNRAKTEAVAAQHGLVNFSIMEVPGGHIMPPVVGHMLRGMMADSSLGQRTLVPV